MTRTSTFIRQFHPLFALAAFVIFTAPPAPAHAAEPVRAAVEVAYGDLNLNSAKGATVMLRRLEHAANVACGVDPYRRGFASHSQRKCRAAALERAVDRLNDPLVSSIYAARDSAGMVFAAR